MAMVRAAALAGFEDQVRLLGVEPNEIFNTGAWVYIGAFFCRQAGATAAL